MTDRHITAPVAAPVAALGNDAPCPRGKVYAFSIECPHRGRALEWQPDGQQFYCPKHKARFSPVGANIGGRRTTALDRFAIRREGAVLVIALDRVLSATDAPAEWNAAVVTV